MTATTDDTRQLVEHRRRRVEQLTTALADSTPNKAPLLTRLLRRAKELLHESRVELDRAVARSADAEHKG